MRYKEDNKNDDSDDSDSLLDEFSDDQDDQQYESEMDKDEYKKMLRRKKKEERERKRFLKKLKKIENKRWYQKFIDIFKRIYNKTWGSFTVEFAIFDKFPHEDAKEMKHNLKGLLYGSLMTYMFFFFLVFSFKKDLTIALYFCMVMLLVAMFGISLSKNLRCIFILVLPCLASSRLRWILLMYASGLIAMGPCLNFMKNSLTFTTSIYCVFDQIYLNMKIVKLIISAPFKLLEGNIKAWSVAVKAVWRQLFKALGLLKYGMFNSGKTVNTQINYLQMLINACNDKSAIYNQCIIFFNNIYHVCYHKLIFGKANCYLIRYVAAIACKSSDKLAEICDNAKMKISSFNSTTAKKSMKHANELFEKLIIEIGRRESNLHFVEKQFQDDVFEDAIEVTNVSQELRERSTEFINTITTAQTTLKIFIMSWTIFALMLIFIQASFFKKFWLKKDSFQNNYITEAFVLLERDAIEKNKFRTLPLLGPEKRKYISLSSKKWTKYEKMMATRGVGIILFSSATMVIVMAMDYLMYFVVLIMEPVFDNSYKARKSIRLQIIVTGVSLIGSLVKTLMSVLGPVRDILTDVDLPLCKPVPKTPNYFLYFIVLCIIILTLLSVAFQVRILRLRHRIMMKFYPERSIQRAIWLRNYIRNTRGSKKLFMLSNIVNKFKKKKAGESETKNKISFIGFLIINSKLCAKVLSILGKKRVFCLSCNAEGNPKKEEWFSRNFTQCDTCKSIFCRACYKYFNNICVMCRNRLIVTEMEIDAQKLSSDEDYEEFKSKYINIINKNLMKRDNN